MGVLNKTIKFFGYIGIGFVTLLSSYFIALAGMCIPMSLICMVWSFIRPLPEWISHSYGFILLQISVVPAILIFIHTVSNVIRKK